jgi:cellobiose dehydrogenase (acceptor)
VLVPHAAATVVDVILAAWSNQYGGGSLDQTGPAGFGYATSTTAVAQPSNPNSTFTQHSYYSNTGLDLSTSHNANYQTYLTGGK